MMIMKPENNKFQLSDFVVIQRKQKKIKKKKVNAAADLRVCRRSMRFRFVSIANVRHGNRRNEELTSYYIIIIITNLFYNIIDNGNSH